MKKQLLVLFIAIVTFTIKTSAQDQIFLKSGDKIEAKILEITIDEIIYKKTSNIEGPSYVISKNDIQILIYNNGESEIFTNNDSSKQRSNYTRSNDSKLKKGSKVYLDYVVSYDGDNVNEEDAEGMLKSYIQGKTTLKVVESKENADFLIELKVVKKAMADRSAQISIINLFNNKIIYESKWYRGSSTVYSGYSGSRAAIGKTVKKGLVKSFPNLKI